MTREEKIKIIDEALERAYRELNRFAADEIPSTDCRTLLKNLQDMEWMRGSQLAIAEDEKDVPMPSHEEPDPAPAAAPAPEAPKPEPEGEDEPKYKMEDVRAALAKARGKGVNVSEIIRSFGAENFQQITPDQYPAVMAKLEGAGA